VLLGVLLIAFLGVRCSHSSVAGDVTETGNAAIAGIVLDQGSRPAADTRVQLVPLSYDPVKDGQLPDSMIDTTDEHGEYAFEGQFNGAYNIQAVRPDDGTMSLHRDVAAGDGVPIRVPADTLREPGAIQLVLPDDADSVNGYLYIAGTDRHVDLSGFDRSRKVVVFEDVPAGVTPAIYYAERQTEAGKQLLADSVAVIANDTTIVDSADTSTTALFIGIDDWGSSYGLVQQNRTLFDYRTAVLDGGVENGWYSWRPNGSYVTEHITQSDTIGEGVAFVYEPFLETNFDTIVSSFNDKAYMTAYFEQYVEFLRMIAGHKAIVILEPFSLAYVAQAWYDDSVRYDPASEFVNVASTGVPEVQGFDNTFKGLMTALLSLPQSLAPDARKAVFLINWAIWPTASPKQLVYWTPTEINDAVRGWKQLLDSLQVLDKVDFVGIGKYGLDAAALGDEYLWDDTRMQNYLYFATAVHTSLGQPLLGWYLPIGHEGLPNTRNRYEDTFAPYFFDHSAEFSAAGFEGMLFGKYEASGTDLSAGADSGDGGWFLQRLTQWRQP
jgi:putative heme iron utilization protein